MSALASETIGGLAPLIARGEVSPVELVEASLERIEAHEPTLHAYVRVEPESAVSAARDAEREIRGGRYLGPLHGIPVAVKDNFAVAGWPTTNGSRLMADHVTDFDAAIVERLRAAGAIVLGKSNMHEWGMGGTCSGMHFGTVRNPWALDRVPGGSSGGSAAAVSAGLAYAAVGADGMGSIRTPASYCGVVGFKPTYGLISRYGSLPPTSSWYDHAGPIARDVKDAAILLSALAGPDPRDPTSLAPPAGWGIDSGRLTLDVTGLRIAIPRTHFFEDATPVVREAVEAAAATFVELGANVTEIELPSLAHVGLVLLGAQTEAHSFLVPLALAHPEGFASEEVRLSILATELVPHTAVRHALQLRNLIRAQVSDAMREVDVLLTPTNSTTAFPIGAHSVEVGTQGGVVDLTKPRAQGRITTRLAWPFNVTGMPAISVPAAETDRGLPIGIQLAARHWDEATLIRSAYAYEQATSGGYRPPPLVVDGGPPAAEAVRG